MIRPRMRRVHMSNMPDAETLTWPWPFDRRNLELNLLIQCELGDRSTLEARDSTSCHPGTHSPAVQDENNRVQDGVSKLTIYFFWRRLFPICPPCLTQFDFHLSPPRMIGSRRHVYRPTTARDQPSCMLLLRT